MRRPLPIWIYSAAAWNRLVDLYFRNRLIGALILDPAPWRHPWFTTVRWSEEAEIWLATVKPGACPSAVSDGDPIVRVDQIVAPAETVARLELAANGREKNLRAYLSEGAPLALRPSIFRAIGTDATGTEAAQPESVPAFFAKRGVMGPRVLRNVNGTAVLAESGLESDRRTARLLRACDVVLTQDRIATVASVRESDISSGTAALEFAPSRAASYDVDPNLIALSKWQGPADLAALDLALGTGTDRGRDEIHLATIYLLSSPGMAGVGTHRHGMDSLCGSSCVLGSATRGPLRLDRGRTDPPRNTDPDPGSGGTGPILAGIRGRYQWEDGGTGSGTGTSKKRGTFFSSLAVLLFCFFKMEEEENTEVRLDGKFPWVLPDTDWEWLDIPANPEPESMKA